MWLTRLDLNYGSMLACACKSMRVPWRQGKEFSISVCPLPQGQEGAAALGGAPSFVI